MTLLRLPGLLDPHVHLREPGATHKEDFTTGTRAALAGGITAVLDMPNNPGEPTVSPGALAHKQELVERNAVCAVGLHYGATASNMDTFEQVAPRVFALKLYLDHTTGDLKIDDLETIREIMRRWPKEKPLCVHAEDRTLAAVLGLLPSVGRGVHFCHVSEKVEIELIRDAKERGLPVTCEVAPHHLYLTENDLPGLGGFGVMKPPLKRPADVDALWANLDIIDMIATDHAPHTLEEKDGEHPAFGVPGLETSLPLMLTAVNRGKLSMDRLVEMMYTAPTGVFRVPTQADTFIEIDLERRWTISAQGMQSKCGWTPFDGMEVIGAVVNVVVAGREVVHGGIVSAQPGSAGILIPVA